MAHLVKISLLRYQDGAGKRVSKNAPGAIAVREKSNKWYGAGIPGQPPKKRVPLSSNRRVAEKMLAELVEDAERGRVGLPNIRVGQMPIADAISRFREDMLLGRASIVRGRGKRPGEEQATQVTHYITTTMAACGVKHVSNLASAFTPKVTRYLDSRIKGAHVDGRISHQTAEWYRKAVVRFAWWLQHRLGASVDHQAFADLPRYNARDNRVHQRRAMTTIEISQLLKSTRESGIVRLGMSGEDRFFLYAVATTTGFRASELAALRVRSFDFDAPIPLVSLPAAETKNGRAATLPIAPALATQLTDYFRPKSANDQLWPGRWAELKYGAKLLKLDLKHAGLAYSKQEATGETYADFHSLRSVFLTRLAEAGVGPKELQLLARHSDARTTLTHYIHASNETLAAAIGRMPNALESGNPLSSMTRADLEQLCLKSLAMNAVLSELVAPRVATLVAP